MVPALPPLGHSLGLITPSGNVVVEWTTMALLRGLPEIGAHFSRLKVAGSSDPFPDSYDWEGVATATELLADARPGVMIWAGSKGVLVGRKTEQELMSRLEDATGLPATSSTIALLAFAERHGLERIALVTPYSDAYQARLVAGFSRLGLEVVAECHAGLADNLSYAGTSPDQILAMAKEVAREADGRAEALLAWCTNLPSAPLADDIERDTGLPFLDATALALHGGLKALDASIPNVPGWGRLFHSAFT